MMNLVTVTKNGNMFRGRSEDLLNGTRNDLLYEVNGLCINPPLSSEEGPIQEVAQAFEDTVLQKVAPQRTCDRIDLLEKLADVAIAMNTDSKLDGEPCCRAFDLLRVTVEAFGFDSSLVSAWIDAGPNARGTDGIVDFILRKVLK